MIQTIIRKNMYQDSIFLMNATQAITELKGVATAVVVMGTDTNKSVLREFGASDADINRAGANDLVLSLDVEREDITNDVTALLDSMISGRNSVGKGKKTKSYSNLGKALDNTPCANMVFISVPGEFASQEAWEALEAGRNVFIFSDNVPLEEEVALKRFAEKHDLWVLGPGCGASLLEGVSVGMMSAVSRGPIGIVGASGSGIHEIASLIDQAGLGITQAIGTGGRDLSQAVGGITMAKGLQWMMRDKDSKVIVLVSKPPHPDVADKILGMVVGCDKPVVVFFLGGDEMRLPEGVYRASTLEDAANKAVCLARGLVPAKEDLAARHVSELGAAAGASRARLRAEQKYLRGLFCGGTHCEESILILRDMVPQIHANISFGGSSLLADVKNSKGHSLIDMGDEELTKGKPHPVMEPSVLKDRLFREATDPEVAVVLFDLLLGYGANKDPVATIFKTLEDIRRKLARENRRVELVCTLTGTDRDPQNFGEQKRRLTELGVAVFHSNAQATMYAGLIVSDREG